MKFTVELLSVLNEHGDELILPTEKHLGQFASQLGRACVNLECLEREIGDLERRQASGASVVTDRLREMRTRHAMEAERALQLDGWIAQMRNALQEHCGHATRLHFEMHRLDFHEWMWCAQYGGGGKDWNNPNLVDRPKFMLALLQAAMDHWPFPEEPTWENIGLHSCALVQTLVNILVLSCTYLPLPTLVPEGKVVGPGVVLPDEIINTEVSYGGSDVGTAD